MKLVPLDEYPYAHLGLDDGVLDGPFLMNDGAFGLLLSLRGRDGGAMPSASEVHWRRDVPPRMRAEVVRVFVRAQGAALFLGEATLTRRGKPERDGYREAFALKEPIAEARWRDLMAEANAPPAPPPEEAVAALAAESTTDERIAAMHVFLARWFDCAELPAEPLASIPIALATLHATIGTRTICAQNRLVAPPALATIDDLTVFYVENQGVCRWAFGDGADPPVLVKVEGGPWRPESPSVSTFILQLLVFEAAMAPPFGASGSVDGRTLKKLAKRVHPLPIGGWTTSRMRFFGAGGVVGAAMPNGPDFDVWLGARDRRRFEPLDDLVSDFAVIGF